MRKKVLAATLATAAPLLNGQPDLSFCAAPTQFRQPVCTPQTPLTNLLDQTAPTDPTNKTVTAITLTHFR
jgi:hypothetical protein